jgi:hypothetical protein
MRLGRTCPDLDALLFFDPDGIQAAYLLRDKVRPAKPRLNDVPRQIACLGGFLARKWRARPQDDLAGAERCSRRGQNQARYARPKRSRVLYNEVR